MSSSEEDKKLTTYTPGGLFNNGLFFEQIEDGKYIQWEAKGKEFVKSPFINWDEVYTPLQRVPWPLCKEPLEYEEAELWKEIYDFIHEHLFLPDAALYDVLTAWVIATWTPEIWTVVPYLFFFGPVSSGKTRGLEVLARLSYRAIISSNISTAALFRACQAWHPTIILDETEIYSKIERGEIIGLLNSGYRKGQFAIRAKSTDQGVELEVFDVFGFKALAGTQALKATLESRSILIRMIQNRRKVNLYIDEDRAHAIRCKLLMYRMKTLRFEKTKETLEWTVSRELNERCERFLERVPPLNFANGRVQELFQSLLAVSNHGQENIVKYAKKMAEIRRFEERASEEAELVELLLSPSLILEEGVVLTKVLADKFNESRNEREKWKSSSVGRLMRRIGFQKRHTRRGNGWLVDQERLTYLSQIYTGDTPTPKKGSYGSHGSPWSDFKQNEGPTKFPKTTVADIIEKVRSRLPSSFEEPRLIEQIVSLGFTREDAEKRVQFLMDKMLIGRDDLGLWHWI